VTQLSTVLTSSTNRPGTSSDGASNRRWSKHSGESERTTDVFAFYVVDEINNKFQILIGSGSTSNTTVATVREHVERRHVRNECWLLTRHTDAPASVAELGLLNARASEKWAIEVAGELRGWHRKSSIPQWLEDAHSKGPARAKRGDLINSFQAINALLKSQRWTELDDALAAADVSKLSPEFLVGLARSTSAVSRHLKNWRRYVENARAELGDARGLPADEILEGLD